MKLFSEKSLFDFFVKSESPNFNIQLISNSIETDTINCLSQF